MAAMGVQGSALNSLLSNDARAGGVETAKRLLGTNIPEGAPKLLKSDDVLNSSPDDMDDVNAWKGSPCEKPLLDSVGVALKWSSLT